MNELTLFPETGIETGQVLFEGSRAAGLSRLDQFAGRSGKHYARTRNFDLGASRRENVSSLSPWIRHRLISEQEVLRATLARHSPVSAEKFIQEVFWRGYFKGWLEQRPGVWTAYQTALQDQQVEVSSDPGPAARYSDAVAGSTGIDCFDAWARELTETGYLHNHTRMWFASIWIFTLRLPWELGADFFLQHLLDGDPASNTLSWRWVGGLHTRGKIYLARASNIARYTDGRFNPAGQLAGEAEPLTETLQHPLQPIPEAAGLPDGEFVLLVTEEDCSPETWLPRPPADVIGLIVPGHRSQSPVASQVHDFKVKAVDDALSRAGSRGEHASDVSSCAAALIAAAQAAGTHTVVTPCAPTGPVADCLKDLACMLQAAGIELRQVRRAYDDLVWPHARSGFFSLRKKIPSVLQTLGLTR